jgi:hypothetical protein
MPVCCVLYPLNPKLVPPPGRQAPIGTVSKPEELIGKRVVTSFPNLTRQYFDGLQKDHNTTIRCETRRPLLW